MTDPGPGAGGHDGAVRRVVILGAGGRDFHDFNVVFRDDPDVRVVAFTAAQIPGIADRRHPPSLAGPAYPDGIPIVDEAEPLIRAERCVDIEYARWRMMAVGAKRHFALDHDDLGTPVDLTEFNKKLLKRTLSQKWQRLLLKWRD